MKIRATFYYEGVFIISEFTPATKGWYYYESFVYADDGSLIEHDSKLVSSTYVSDRLRSCRKYHGYLQIVRLCNNIFTVTYQRDYHEYALSHKK